MGLIDISSHHFVSRIFRMKLKKITRDQAIHAIKTGEFGDDVIASNTKVAVLLTQDWCPQWHSMKGWLYDLDMDCDLHELIYNLEDYFDEFKNFKETKWRNGLVPYIRYYFKGKLVHESNYVSREEFMRNFE
jgi:hypothetical protein